MFNFLFKKLRTPQAIEEGHFTCNRSFSEIKSISENDLLRSEDETRINFIFDFNHFSFILMSKYQKVNFDMTEDYKIVFCQKNEQNFEFKLNFLNGYSRLGTFTVVTVKEK